MSEAPIGRTLACVMGNLDMVRPLGLAGIRCAVVTRPSGSALHSRYTQTALCWDDFEEGPEELLEMLMRFGGSQDEPPVLYYQHDAQLLFVSRYRERLSQAFRFVIPDRELVEDLVDKARFQALAERLDLPVPPTRRLDLSKDGELPELGLHFPVILKPLTRLKIWSQLGNAGKVLQIDTPEALRELWPRLVEAKVDLLAQEAIPGPETRIESYHVYVDPQGRIAGEFTGRKIRTYPKSFGYSTALTITDAPDVAALGRDLVERLNFRGVAKFDFKRAPDGKLYLLEVNPRFNLWHHLGAVAGMNLPALVHADMLGLPRPPMSEARPGACWCHLSKDRLAAKESGVPRLAWLSWVLRCDAKEITLDDPMPFLRKQLSRIRPRRRRARPATVARPA